MELSPLVLHLHYLSPAISYQASSVFYSCCGFFERQILFLLTSQLWTWTRIILRCFNKSQNNVPVSCCVSFTFRMPVGSASSLGGGGGGGTAFPTRKTIKLHMHTTEPQTVDCVPVVCTEHSTVVVRVVSFLSVNRHSVHCSEPEAWKKGPLQNFTKAKDEQNSFGRRVFAKITRVWAFKRSCMQTSLRLDTGSVHFRLLDGD